MAVCLVTGGAGFIGSHLVEALLTRGHSVRVLDNFSTGTSENLAAVEDRVQIIRGTVTDYPTVRAAVAGADYVFHLAAPPAGTQGLDDAVGIHHCGATGTLHVLLGAREAKVRRVVYSSSCCVYGHANGLPRREGEPTQPLSPYALAKLAGEQQCLGFTALYGLETVRLRYFNVFGPRQPPDGPYAAAAASAVKQMLAGRRPAVPGGAGGAQEIIYVDDVVHANLLAATVPRAAGKVYNIAGGRPTYGAEVVAALNLLLRTDLQPAETLARIGEEFSNLADVSKAEQELGFCPATDLQKGLRQCLNNHLMWGNRISGQPRGGLAAPARGVETCREI